MAKKLIVFFDGTGNTPTTKDGNFPTNVAKLLEATTCHDADNHPQIVHYVAGVGTSRWEKIRGWGGGYGISDNIKSGYQFLCCNYEPDDDIFLFGFSRGAYTARSLAGLIHYSGLLKKKDIDLIDTVYENYHKNPKPTINNDTYRPKIKFVGVWDTVGALGSPFGLIFGGLIKLIYGPRYHDVSLNGSIQSAFHLLANDEKRWTHRPVLFQNANPAILKEEWLDGNHADVGGGYANTTLSDDGLKRMAAEAKYHGLALDQSILDSLPKPPSTEIAEKEPVPHDETKTPAGFVTLVSTLLLVKWPAFIVTKFISKDDPNIAQKIKDIDCKGYYHRNFEKSLCPPGKP